ncbi:MAG: 2-oxo acid dehydrogenase subunit E2 [Chloroflexi bacterium HGW-Chloroflexi-8]|nr:MAG: 2-oxo acid dehydrogenase subunit E2 [Chloroflexi bacterium HGW-Chloroflexi-8]
MATKIIMPKLGESVVEGTVVNWLKKEGDLVEEFESLLEVESAKVSTEIPSPASGVLIKILVDAGMTVSADTIIGWIGSSGELVPDLEGETKKVRIDELNDRKVQIGKNEIEFLPVDMEDTQAQPNYIVGRDHEIGFISPVVAKMAQEHNIKLDLVKGTGQGGRITKKDLSTYIESKQTKLVEPEQAAWETPGEGDLFRPAELQFPGRYNQGDVIKKEETLSKQQPDNQNFRIIPHTKIRKTIAEHMVFSKHTSPHVTTVMEVDMQNVVNHRDKNKFDPSERGIRLTFTAYFISAIAHALQKFPIVNSSWSDEGIVVKSSINVGMATSLGESGLIVPVIKNADSYSLTGLAQIVNDLADRARNQKLRPDEVMGGTFTLTNHGTSGSLFATPIINQPQCAILGVGAIQKRVKVINDAIAIRPMVYLSLTFDHRILDGASADGFLAKIVEILENWQ